MALELGSSSLEIYPTNDLHIVDFIDFVPGVLEGAQLHLLEEQI